MLIEQMLKRLHWQTSFEGAAHTVLDDAIALQGAEYGNVQLTAGEYLIIAVQRGFKAPFLETFREVTSDDGCACGRALRTGHTVVITDTETDAEYAPFRAAARAAGYRSVMTTPLLTREKVLVGTVSTHFVSVHTPTSIEIDTLGIYGVAAADHLHTLLGDESIETRARSMSRRLYNEAEAN